MIMLTRLDGMPVCVNEINILWVEALPDTSVMLLGGTRILVKESVQTVKELINELVLGKTAIHHGKPSTGPRSDAAEELGP